MIKLIINRFKYRFEKTTTSLLLSYTDNLSFAKDATYFVEQLNKTEYSKEIQKFLSLAPEDFDINKSKIFYGFNSTKNNVAHTAQIDFNNIGFLKKSYIKESLITFFLLRGFFVEPYITGVDLSVYQKSNKHNNDNWDIYNKYDITIYTWDNEISISVNSTNTILLPYKSEYITADLKVVTKEGLIKKYKFVEGSELKKIVADFNTRKGLGIKQIIKKTFYPEYHSLINDLYEILLTEYNNDIIFESGGFKSIHPSDIGEVNYDNNLMLFGKGQTNINAATGIREGGAFEIATEKAENIKFLFIYENKDQANNLYLHLKKGLKHFPGLLSYIGIQVNLSNERVQYSDINGLATLLEQKLANDNYANYFALVIVPYSKLTASESEMNSYFKVKEVLLKKGIPSQFLEGKKINSNTFHYQLANISVAILAKIGGVPWKLKTKNYEELIVGFNEAHLYDNYMIGSAIYFDNSGKLKQITSFPRTQKRNELIISLRESIKAYLNQSKNIKPERLVIHYYKPPKKRDIQDINQLIRDEFRFNLPFALVEINDSKDKSDLCFDVDYNYGMPTSGTYVKLRRKENEFLLFNNLRYWEKPLKNIDIDEYPLKIKLYNTESGGFTHKELLSQVYEFSRLYWKALRQQSQPVTTQYSKLIADFALHFENNIIPMNEVSQNTAWFI